MLRTPGGPPKVGVDSEALPSAVPDRTVVGVFSRQADAASCMRRLEAEGFAEERVGWLSLEGGSGPREPYRSLLAAGKILVTVEAPGRQTDAANVIRVCSGTVRSTIADAVSRASGILPSAAPAADSRPLD